MEIPNLPLVTKVPETDGFNIDCDKLTKKLNRLMLASPENFGIKFKLNGDILSMETVTDRVSYEKINCRRIGKSVNDLEFIMESGFLQKILNLYEAADVDIYIDGQRCIIHSSADILIEKTNEKRPFTAIGLLTQAQIV
jgi:hypothetical protein